MLVLIPQSRDIAERLKELAKNGFQGLPQARGVSGFTDSGNREGQPIRRLRAEYQPGSTTCSVRCLSGGTGVVWCKAAKSMAECQTAVHPEYVMRKNSGR